MGHVLEAVSVRAESDGPERAVRNLPGVGCGAPRKSARLAARAIPNRTSPTRVHEPTRCRRRTPHSVSPRAPPPSAASPRRCARAAVRPRARQRSSLSAPRARAPRTPTDPVPPSRPTGWTFNFFFSQLLWWLYAYKAMNDYGYDDANKDSSTGAIPSGPSGSGVAIVPTMLMVVGLATWTGKLLTFKPATA